jgi:hypothetical protein
MSSQKYPLCHDRKPKRSCPALDKTICAVCCATKREVEIACPPDCPYLSSARAHPPAIVQRRQMRDLSFVVPLVTDLTEAQHHLLVLFQSLVVKHSESAVPPILDQDVAEGAAAAAATLETARKGIIYEHRAVSIPAQRLTSELGRAIAELSRQSGSQARLERDAAIALRRLEKGARTAADSLVGDEPPVYLKLLGRLLKEGTTRPSDEGEPTASGLILPP